MAATGASGSGEKIQDSSGHSRSRQDSVGSGISDRNSLRSVDNNNNTTDDPAPAPDDQGLLSFNPLSYGWDRVPKRRLTSGGSSVSGGDLSYNPLNNRWESMPARRSSAFSPDNNGSDTESDKENQRGHEHDEEVDSFDEFQSGTNKPGGERRMSGGEEEDGRWNVVDPEIDLDPEASQRRTSVPTSVFSWSNKNVLYRTRAPPRRFYEASPFLSIDNRPEPMTKASEETLNNPASSKPSFGVSLPKVPRNTPALTNSNYLSNQQPTAISSSTEWNRFVPTKHREISQRAREIMSNQHVRSPFKQDRNLPSQKNSRVIPEQFLKEATASATYHVARAIATAAVETERKIPGRLLKARLRPLNTVNVSGPSIHQCRGIVVENPHQPLPSKTLMRQVDLLKNVDIGDFLSRQRRPRSLDSDATDAENQRQNDDFVPESDERFLEGRLGAERGSDNENHQQQLQQQLQQQQHHLQEQEQQQQQQEEQEQQQQQQQQQQHEQQQQQQQQEQQQLQEQQLQNEQQQQQQQQQQQLQQHQLLRLKPTDPFMA